MEKKACNDIDNVVLEGTSKKFEYDEYCDGGKITSVPGRFTVNGGGMTLCSRMNVS
jgi:hypothetical protein